MQLEIILSQTFLFSQILAVCKTAFQISVREEIRHSTLEYAPFKD